MNVVTELKPVQKKGSQNWITAYETTKLKCGLECLQQQLMMRISIQAYQLNYYTKYYWLQKKQTNITFPTRSLNQVHKHHNVWMYHIYLRHRTLKITSSHAANAHPIRQWESAIPMSNIIIIYKPNVIQWLHLVPHAPVCPLWLQQQAHTHLRWCSHISLCIARYII